MKRSLVILSVVIIFTSVSMASNYRINGEFKGWDGNTVVILSDGSKWEQAVYYYQYCYQYNPKVNLYKEYGNYYMVVDGCGDKAVQVKPYRSTSSNSGGGEWDALIEQSSEVAERYSKRNQEAAAEANRKQFEQMTKDNEKAIEEEKILYEKIRKKKIEEQEREEKLKKEQLAKLNSNKREKDDPEESYLKIYNSNYKTIYIAVRYLDENVWCNQGWYEIKSKESIDLKYYNYRDYVYIYAVDENGYIRNNISGPKYNNCVMINENFKICGNENSDCRNNGYKMVEMNSYFINYGYNKITIE